MAQNAPSCKDTQDVQFKLHDKFVTFLKCGEPRSNVKLLAVSSTRGLLFAGNPTAPELKVILLKDLVDSKTNGKQPLARSVPLPSVPNYMSCSSDGNLLAINFTQNGTSLLNIYSVPSMMTTHVQSVYNIRLAPEDYVYAAQLLWNPVMANSLAVVLSNGGLGMYSLKDGGNFELHSLDKSQQVKCGCWSPKGKQIVLGFPNGKLQQFKPDLTPAKTLLCPPNVHEGPFDTLAIQWLSTYQFAVIFLQHGEDCNPSLYIMNAPKAGTPSYVNYYDICYSLNGPRNHQFHFTHIAQWNLLLVTSANGVEVGVLATYEAGDTPAWQQLTLLDEARIELPLSEINQEETFPLGFAYDTSATHQLVINEQKLPIMPMVHVLGTDGHLLSFNFLNLVTGAASVCSPPPPVTDNSGQFLPLDKSLPAHEEQEQIQTNPQSAPEPPASTAASDISFAFTPNTVTSTPAPAKDKPTSLFAGFGANLSKAPSASQLTFGGPAAPLSFAAAAPAPAAAPPAAARFGGAPGGGAMFGGLNLVKPAPVQVPTPAPAPAPPAAAPVLAPAPVSAPLPVAAPPASVINTKPLYEIPPTFAPTAGKASSPTEVLPLDDTEPIIREMIAMEIDIFNQDLQNQKAKTRELMKKIEAPSALKDYAKRLDDLQEINDQALDVDFELDVQALRQGLNEAYAIVAECRSKLETYHQPDITRLMTSNAFDPSNRRTIARLQSYVSANEAQLLVLQELVDTQWEQFQDVVRRNSKSQMHIPCLEGIYQRLTRLQNQTSDQRIKQNIIKAKLKDRGLLQAALLDQENSRNRTNEAVDNLTSSILSLNLSQVVDLNRSKLSQTKLEKIRSSILNQKVSVISPQRPDRIGLQSEVILETKRKADLKKKAAQAAAAAAAAAAKVPSKSNKGVQVVQAVTTPTIAPQLQKPTASKPPPVVSMDKKTAVSSSTPASSASSAFAFSQSSPFVKTSAVTTTTATLTTGSSLFGSNFSFNQPAAVAPVGSAKPVPAFGNVTGFAGFGAGATIKEPVKPTPFAGFGASVVSKPPDTVKPKEEAPIEKPPSTPKVDKPFSFAPDSSSGATQTPANPPAVSLSTSSASAFSFGGLGIALSGGGGGAATAAVKPSTGGLSFGQKPTTKETAAPNLAPIPTTSTATPTPTPVTSSSSSDPDAGLFGSISICKPQVKESVGEGDVKPANPFSGFGNISSVPSFSFGATKEDANKVVTTSASTPAATTAPTVTTTASATAVPSAGIFGQVSSTLGFGMPKSTAAPTSTPIVASTTTATTAPTPTPTPSVTTAVATPAVTSTSTFSFSNAFSSLGTSSNPTTTSAPVSVFGGGGLFGSTAAAATTTTAPTSIFQQAAAATSSSTPTTASTVTTNIFGNVPKPEASVFGGTSAPAAAPAAAAPPSGLFAAAAAATPSPFGSTSPGGNASSGGNIFAQAAKPTGFGQTPVSPAAPATGSIFGGGTSTGSSPFGNTSIFGGGNQSAAGNTAAGGPTGGSIFGQSVFGQAAPAAAPAVASGNIFASPVSSSQQTSAFGGGGGSIFGTASNTAASPTSGGSIFGGGTSSGGFGSFSQTTPAPGGFGSGFAQTAGASVAQTGFGSPQQQQTPPQTTPGGFGAKPVFGGAPAFGTSPTFGGAATFGSPKGFGGFGVNPTVASPPAFGAPAKPAEGNIFETLGGQESGLSFGNLAQTGNPNAMKPAFGGSSFMNYR
ncbi:uncharacterized protein Dwil_GK19609 [Drosophila willistoni]|uniref:Nuclear pore complex protein Nup214 n=1 Tax=Drosophila willistoni TaxID=7260 RepID=B4MNM6_DROWI|nr:nuclear pore complex protein Nup214 [Drosophila willistoni]EDW73715.1 uncharacterized protein Dwil_GK19609 [Drosophila willistoni]